MALAKGTNSYVDVTEADAYLANRLAATEWAAAITADKERALITATGILDDLSWVGSVISDSQSLAFPRIGSYFDPALGCDVLLPDGAVPERVQKATFELALHLYLNQDVLTDSGSVRNLNVSGIGLNTIIGPSRLPSTIKRIIRPLLENQGNNSWWRAN